MKARFEFASDAEYRKYLLLYFTAAAMATLMQGDRAISYVSEYAPKYAEGVLVHLEKTGRL